METATKQLRDRQRKKSKSGEDGSYQTAQAGHGQGRRKIIKTEEDGSYHTAEVSLGDRGQNKS